MKLKEKDFVELEASLYGATEDLASVQIRLHSIEKEKVTEVREQFNAFVSDIKKILEG